MKAAHPVTYKWLSVGLNVLTYSSAVLVVVELNMNSQFEFKGL